MNQLPACDWYEKAAEDIVRNDSTLFAWSNKNRKGFTQVECANIARTKEFQATLRVARNKIYKELATDPSRNKNTALGQLVFLIQKMIDAELFDKAVAAIAQLAKLEGWTSDQTQIGIVNDLSGKEIDALRAKLAAKMLKTETKELAN